MNDSIAKRLNIFLKTEGAILAYRFGSSITGYQGPMSDIDIAILWPETEKFPQMRSLRIQQEINKSYKKTNIEVGPLNGQNLSFCYEVISTGICIYGREEDRVRYETNILNQYLDFKPLSEQYNYAFRSYYFGGE